MPLMSPPIPHLHGCLPALLLQGKRFPTPASSFNPDSRRLTTRPSELAVPPSRSEPAAESKWSVGRNVLASQLRRSPGNRAIHLDVNVVGLVECRCERAAEPMMARHKVKDELGIAGAEVLHRRLDHDR